MGTIRKFRKGIIQVKDYGPYLQKALKNLVHDVLLNVSKNGLTDESYYMISFQTPKSIIPDFVRSKYPSEMTIILQNQFEDLRVNETDFSVTLSFGGIPCEICIPFDSILDFADPTKKFGLSLNPTPITKSNKEEQKAEIIDFCKFKKNK